MALAPELENEAAVLTRYLVRQSPAAHHVALYRNVMTEKGLQPLPLIGKHPRLLGFIDAHDALFRSNSDLRQRLYLMFSILEASTEFADEFLPRQRPPVYIIVVGFAGIRGVLRLLVGIVIVKVAGL